MGGILGIATRGAPLPVDAGMARSALESLSHRGAAGSGEATTLTAYLGNTYIEAVGNGDGRLPASPDGRYAVAFSAYNHRQDRVGVQHGLEIRMPYQDHEVARYANALPTALKHRGDWRKWLLRRVAERHLPHDAVWQSAKQMFALLVAHLFEDRLGRIYRETLAPGCRLSSWYSVEGMHQLLHRATVPGRDNSNTLWRLLTLELWLRALPTAR